MSANKELIERDHGKHLQVPFRLLKPELVHFSEEKDPLYFEIFKLPAFQRLQGIKALGFLAHIRDDWDTGDLKRVPSEERGFPHSRMYHSILVARLTEAILLENNFPEEEVRLGILAGLLHDVATPAGGDAIKGLSPKRLDEEDFWKEVVGLQGKKTIHRAGVSTKELDRAIHNQGIVGKVLDVADRFAYTYADTFYIHGIDLANAGPFPHIYPQQEIKVNRETEEIVFTDPFALKEVLSKRAENFFHTYMFPTNRAADMLIRKLVAPYYAEDGSKPLSPEKLREMTDDELFDFLHDQYGLLTADSFQKAFVSFPTEYYDTTPSEIEGLKHHINTRPSMIIIGAEWLPKVNPCTSYLVKHPSTGEVMPFREFDRQAHTIELLTESRGNFFLYAYDASEPTRFNEVVKSVLGK